MKLPVVIYSFLFFSVDLIGDEFHPTMDAMMRVTVVYHCEKERGMSVDKNGSSITTPLLSTVLSIILSEEYINRIYFTMGSDCQ